MAVRYAARGRLDQLSVIFSYYNPPQKLLDTSTKYLSRNGFCSTKGYATAVQAGGGNTTDQSAVITKDDLPRNERYIPVTRRALVRSFMEDQSLLTGTERDNFAEFAASLDAYIYQKFYQMLDEMKVRRPPRQQLVSDM